GLSITAEGASQLAVGIWEFDMPPHQVRFFGECRRSEAGRSILLLEAAQYDPARGSLHFDADKVIPLHVGSSTRALAVTAGNPASVVGSKIASTTSDVGGPGDREFLSVASELPPVAYDAAKALLRKIREKSPGDLKRGLQRNFSNTPDNFWY